MTQHIGIVGCTESPLIMNDTNSPLPDAGLHPPAGTGGAEEGGGVTHIPSPASYAGEG